jgi:ribosome-associated protein
MDHAVSRPRHVDPAEVTFTPVRAQGPGGQNVNKVANAVQLRFDVRASSLPDDVKQRLLALRDARITDQGVVVIKAQEYRSLQANRRDALRRLDELIASVAVPPKRRRPTRPTLASRQRRLDTKTRRGQVKALRGRVEG